MTTVLLYETNRREADMLQQALSEVGHQDDVRHANSIESLRDALSENEIPALLILGHQPEDFDIRTLHEIQALQPGLPVIISNEHVDAAGAINTVREGVFDLVNPHIRERFSHTVDRALELQNLTVAPQLEQDLFIPSLDQFAIIGTSRPLQELCKSIGRVAATNASVLIRGESGTGKELVARAIHAHSMRSAAPLTIINCAAIPENLLESKLFGHEAGAFTDATRRRVGQFEQASSATIFLDEVGELALGSQAKLLRALQYQEIERLGGTGVIKVDVRVIAATNCDLEEAVLEGKFREDLYHRLNVVPITVPPLRHHKEDIPILVKLFVNRFANDYQETPPRIAAEAMDVLLDYDWPGNVRELENCVDQALIMSGGFPIMGSDILSILAGQRDMEEIPQEGEAGLRTVVSEYLACSGSEHPFRDLREFSESVMLREALARVEGNQTKAAGLLGISRPSIQAKMKKYTIESTTVLK